MVTFLKTLIFRKMSFVVQSIIFIAGLLIAVQSIYYLREPIVTSPGILPLIVAMAIVVISGTLLVFDFMGGRYSIKQGYQWLTSAANRAKIGRISGWLGLASAYAITTPQIGFTWATLAFLILALKIFARLNWVRTMIYAALVATIVPLIFHYVFSAIIP